MKNKNRPILIVIGNNKNGGIAKHASMLANGFSTEGRDVTIIVTKDDAEQGSFFSLNENVNILGVNQVSKNTTRYVMAKMLASIEIKVLKLVNALLPTGSNRQKKVSYSVPMIRKTLDLKQCLEGYTNPIIITLGLEYAINVYYATRFQKCDIMYATKTYAEGEVINLDLDIVCYVLDKLACVVCQTEYTAEYFRRLGAQRTQVIGNPLEMKLDPYVGDRNKSIVNFCRISKEKRLDLLIKAFAKFHKKYADYHIDIYGNIVREAEDAHRVELLNLIHGLGIQDYVKIYPARKDIHEVVKNAAMFVSTSEFEGLSNSMIEAMALGMPCICTDCDGGGAREQIKNGFNGLLIPKNDEEALIEAMLKFAENQEFAKKCGKNAVAIREKLEISKITEQWLDAIDKYCK